MTERFRSSDDDSKSVVFPSAGPICNGISSIAIPASGCDDIWLNGAWDGYRCKESWTAARGNAPSHLHTSALVSRVHSTRSLPCTGSTPSPFLSPSPCSHSYLPIDSMFSDSHT